MDHFERNGYEFPVIDTGPRDGPAVVLLHGFPQQPSGWNAVARRLNAEGLRTLIPAQRGYVATARPTRRRAYATSEVTADVIALLDAADLTSAHIVGHDWGGAQAWGVASRHPDRVASLTVLSTPHPAAFQKSVTSSNQALRSWYMGLFQLPLLPEFLARRTLTKMLTNSRLPAENVTDYVSAMAEPGALTGAFNWYRGLPFSPREPVGPITVPTSYLWGSHDFALGRRAAELTGGNVSAPYDFIELDSGHWLPEVEPEAVAAAITARVRG